MKRQPRPAPIVTREWLQREIIKRPGHVIGRALVAIYHRQTDEEQAFATAKLLNGVGFSAFDARVGTRCALLYLKNGGLPLWATPQANGYPRICRYATQLNAIAYERRRRLLGIDLLAGNNVTPAEETLAGWYWYAPDVTNLIVYSWIKWCKDEPSTQN